MYIALNPAPMNDRVQNYPLNLVDLFIVNETEAYALANCAETARTNLQKRFPQASLVITQEAKRCFSRFTSTAQARTTANRSS